MVSSPGLCADYPFLRRKRMKLITCGARHLDSQERCTSSDSGSPMHCMIEACSNIDEYGPLILPRIQRVSLAIC